jgi:hypothetical protein
VHVSVIICAHNEASHLPGCLHSLLAQTRIPDDEPFLLCDFDVHTRWSDGQLTVEEVVDLYGKTGKFDVIAIRSHPDEA